MVVTRIEFTQPKINSTKNNYLHLIYNIQKYLITLFLEKGHFLSNITKGSVFILDQKRFWIILWSQFCL